MKDFFCRLTVGAIARRESRTGQNTVANVSLCIALLFCSAMISGCARSTGEPIVGISKIVSHPALDAVEKGIRDELKARNTRVFCDVQNANGDISAVASIANKFQSENVIIAVGISTPSAQSLVNTLKDIPVIFTAVTDPIGAGLVSSLNKGEKFVTGVSDMTPVREQIALLARLKPIQKIGLIYTSSEDNSLTILALAKQACNELGIELTVTAVSRSSEVKEAVQTIIGRVDGLYLGTDNTVISALASISEVAMKANVPIISADPSSAERFDVLLALGFDYYKMGRVTGQLISEVLNGKKLDDIPTRFMTKPSDMNLVINFDVAKQLGITIPPDVAAQATSTISNGQIVRGSPND